MQPTIFNTELQAALSTDGGKIGYSNGTFLGGLTPITVTGNVTIDWTYLGKAVLCQTNSQAINVTLPALTGKNGMSIHVQREGSNTVTILSPGGSSITLDEDSSWVQLYADEPGNKWRVLNGGGKTFLDVIDSDGINLEIGGAGTPDDPLIITPEIVLDPDTGNLIGKSALGLVAKVHVTGAGITGKGTAAEPLQVEAYVLTRLRVVNQLSERDAAFVNPGAKEGDTVKVISGANGLPQTFIRNNAGAWIEIEDRDSVLSVNGQTGHVVLGIQHMDDVDLTNLQVGQHLSWNGTKWVVANYPVNSYLTTQTPTSTGVTITHNMNVRTVHHDALNLTTNNYETLSWQRIDNNSLKVFGLIPTQYEIRLTKGNTN